MIRGFVPDDVDVEERGQAERGRVLAVGEAGTVVGARVAARPCRGPSPSGRRPSPAGTCPGRRPCRRPRRSLRGPRACRAGRPGRRRTCPPAAWPKPSCAFTLSSGAPPSSPASGAMQRDDLVLVAPGPVIPGGAGEVRAVELRALHHRDPARLAARDVLQPRADLDLAGEGGVVVLQVRVRRGQPVDLVRRRRSSSAPASGR